MQVWNINNIINIWNIIIIIIKEEKSLLRSDHSMVLAHPRETVKANRKIAYFRDVRHQNHAVKNYACCELEHVDWDVITSHERIVDENNGQYVL